MDCNKFSMLVSLIHLYMMRTYIRCVLRENTLICSVSDIFVSALFYNNQVNDFVKVLNF